MYSIELEKKCGCAKKDNSIDERLSKTFTSLEEAELEALKLANHMNATWCKKHRFYVNQAEEVMQIMMELACPNEPK